MNPQSFVFSWDVLPRSSSRVRPTATVLALAIALMPAAPQAADRAEELLARARAELGGEQLATVTALSARGEFRRLFGEREITGDLTIDLAVPDRIRRTEEMGVAGGPSMTRTVALNRGEFWEDMTNRGGGFFRMAPGGAGGPRGPGGREITEEDRARFREMQKRRLEGELRRYLLVWLLRTDAPVKHGGRAEAEDGSAEVLEVDTDGLGPMRLFLDEQSMQPLMLTYEGFRPRVRMMRPRRPAPNEPARRVTFELRFDDYREVDGIRLPHRLTTSIEGEPTEEWTIDRYKVNPSFKASHFEER